jgi:hypothetical protein
LGEVRGNISKGVHTFSLNAADYDLEEGQIINLNVNATNSDGESLSGGITSSIRVDGIWSDGEDSFLTAGEMSFRSSDISKVMRDNPPQPITQPTQPGA